MLCIQIITWIKHFYLTPIINQFRVLLSVKSGVESVILVSNLYNTKLWPIDEETADDELFVVYNGPEIGEVDDVLTEALARHFKDPMADTSPPTIISKHIT